MTAAVRPPATLTVPAVNDASVPALLAATGLDFAVVCGTSLIRQPLLGALGCAVNLHAGYLPWHKGNHTIFFACRDRAWDRLGRPSTCSTRSWTAVR